MSPRDIKRYKDWNIVGLGEVNDGVVEARRERNKSISTHAVQRPRT
jgi:hypothetical protein